MNTLQLLTGKRGLGHFARARELRRLLQSEYPDGEHRVAATTSLAKLYPGDVPSHYDLLPDDRSGAGRTIVDLVSTVQPGLLLVDNRPEGPSDAMTQRVLRRIRVLTPSCLVVLATRDVLDSAQVMRNAWAAPTIRRLLAGYDAVWCFGSSELYDIGSEYRIDRDVRYLGYLAAEASPCVCTDCRVDVTVTAGGGQDAHWMLPVLRALRECIGFGGVRAILGPHSPDLVQQRIWAMRADGLTVTRATRGLLDVEACGHTVIGMGGYNTVAETLRSGRSLVAVPRNQPTMEQRIRVSMLVDAELAHQIPSSQLCDVSSSRIIEDALAWAQRPRPRSDALQFADGMAIRQAVAAVG